MVHSINVTFDDSNFIHGQKALKLQSASSYQTLGLHMKPNDSSGLNSAAAASPLASSAAPNSSVPHTPVIFSDSHVMIEQCSLFDEVNQTVNEPEYFDITEDGSWLWTQDELQARPRPSYARNFLVQIDLATRLEPIARDAALVLAVSIFTGQQGSKFDHGSISSASRLLALTAQKDNKWKKALAGPDSDKAIAALYSEKDSLLDTVLVKIDKDHPDYNTALAQAITGRFLLDIRRNGMWKSRGVKQGFKENKQTADGPDFVYYSHVAKLYTIRISLFRPNRGTRRAAIRDVKTAFLQSDSYPDAIQKHVTFFDPVLQEWELFRQRGPLYGENSAPVRWENTFAPSIQAIDFVRGENDKSIFYHEDRDLLDLVFVDDNFLDGEEDDINWASDQIGDRFECKELEWLQPNGPPLDYLGMELYQTDTHVSISMETYIVNCLDYMGWTDCKPASTPMIDPIDPDTPKLSDDLIPYFHTGKGFADWLANTNRPDIAYANSRIGQHQANPTQSAYDALHRLFRYLSGTRKLRLAAPTHTHQNNFSDQSLFQSHSGPDQYHWEFYTDSDFAGNAEPQNKRRSQNGYIVLLNGTPVYWVSMVSSVCFASSGIGESHADISSAAAEIYCAGNATMDFLHLSHVADEMGVKFPKPFLLQMDNEAAKCFADDSCFKTKLKHIDCRQEQVKLLRDKDICKPKKVPTGDNLADIFTNILPSKTFLHLRSRIMVDPDQ